MLRQLSFAAAFAAPASKELTVPVPQPALIATNRPGAVLPAVRTEAVASGAGAGAKAGGGDAEERPAKRRKVTAPTALPRVYPGVS